MIINEINLSAVFTGFKAAYSSGFEGAKTVWASVAMEVPSTTEKEIYGWLGQLPGMREWIGDRMIKNIVAKGFAIENLDFESTISVPRNKIEDDLYGIFSPLMTELGRAAAAHPDELVFKTLAKGWTEHCYDGQFFFDTDHPVGNGSAADTVSVSNNGGGTGTPWYLLDTSRAIRPLIFQKRRGYNLVAKDDPRDDSVFMKKQYLYGVDARGNAGFGLWQLAYGSKQELNATNYEAARTAMQQFKGDEGRALGIKPTVLIVPPTLEGPALDLINSTTLESGQSNKWHKSVEVIVTPWAA